MATETSTVALNVDDAVTGMREAFRDFLDTKEGAGGAQMRLLNRIAALNPEGKDVDKKVAQEIVDKALKALGNHSAIDSAKSEVSRAVSVLRAGAPRWQEALSDAAELKGQLGPALTTNKLVVATGIAGTMAKGEYVKEAFFEDRAVKVGKTIAKKEEEKAQPLHALIQDWMAKLEGKSFKITAAKAHASYDVAAADGARIALARLLDSVAYGGAPAKTAAPAPEAPAKGNGAKRPPKGAPATAIPGALSA